MQQHRPSASDSNGRFQEPNRTGAPGGSARRAWRGRGSGDGKVKSERRQGHGSRIKELNRRGFSSAPSTYTDQSASLVALAVTCNSSGIYERTGRSLESGGRESDSKRTLDVPAAGSSQRILASQLRVKAGEIEELVFDRLAVLEGKGHNRRHGLTLQRTVLRAAIDYGLVALENGERHTPALPPTLISHARNAAARAFPLQDLLSRYLAGYSLFKDCLLEEHEAAKLALCDFRQVSRSLDVAFERLVRALSEEHERELQARGLSVDARQLKRIEELLEGKLLGAPELGYKFEAVHIGLVAIGPSAAGVARQLAGALGTQHLLVRPTSESVWAWMGSNSKLSAAQLAAHLPSPWPEDVKLALGEPAAGLHGWRRSHRQARAAFGVIATSEQPVIRYAEVPLLASTAGDDLLQVSLREMYLVPLTDAQDGGEVLRRTLRAYFAVGRNRASAAAALGFSRQTIAQRLQRVEDLLGEPLTQCGDALDLALQLEERGFIAP